VGRALQALLRQRGHEVRSLVRRSTLREDEVTWHPERGESPHEAVAWADAVVSLNGASLAALPWTRRYRRLILESRVTTTRLLARTIAAVQPGPRVWVSASAAGVYGDRPGESLTETSARGTGFLAEVVTAWEDATAPATRTSRVVLARTGVVLSPAAGVLAPLQRLARYGLGGRIGSGRQHWPWISLDDETHAIVHLMESSALSGPVNLASPVPATATDITRAVARAWHRPHIVPAPAWVLRALFGDAARDLLLADQRVQPARLLDEGIFRVGQVDVAAAVTAAVGGDLRDNRSVSRA
jgi:uncharacterized protein (TIGR01777 family)